MSPYSNSSYALETTLLLSVCSRTFWLKGSNLDMCVSVGGDRMALSSISSCMPEGLDLSSFCLELMVSDGMEMYLELAVHLFSLVW